ncbi:hypothetical protein FG383_19605 [Psychrobacillus soli]|uniref:Uncharacterized protein n=1 Tax=Psychrobacillus soli TaxID=1543965 RepID=A0A544SK21_9BACI|nr:hypothetical protein FG383_19605 [Psychrobacillus soli]
MVYSSGQLEDYLEDSIWSPFPQFLNTKRPDRVVANLMEGKIAILSDANTDALGLGRIARAFHPDLFQEGKWNETYPTLTITPSVQVKITDTGILD